MMPLARVWGAPFSRAASTRTSRIFPGRFHLMPERNRSRRAISGRSCRRSSSVQSRTVPCMDARNRTSSTLSPVLSWAERSNALIVRTYSSRVLRIARPSAAVANAYAEAAGSFADCAKAPCAAPPTLRKRIRKRSAVVGLLPLLRRPRMHIVHPMHLLRLLDHWNIQVHDHGLLAAADEHA